VEGSQRLAEEVLRHLSRHRRRLVLPLLGVVMEEEERLVGLDEFVHLGNLPHRAHTIIRHGVSSIQINL
jgi:hypothetical protein